MKTYTIKKTAGLTLEQVYREIAFGGRFVSYAYCVSIIAFTFRLLSSPHLLKQNEPLSRYLAGYNIRTLLFGWWGFPWGPFYVIDMIKVNARQGGGMDVTEHILAKIKEKYADAPKNIPLEEDLEIAYGDHELTGDGVKVQNHLL